MTTVLQTIKALDKTPETVKPDLQSDLKWLAENFDLILSIGEALLQKREKLNDEKQIKRFIKDHGGKNFTEPYLQIASWYRSLTTEWRDKIRSLPFWNLEKDQWAKLAQLNLEQLIEWYEEIIELSEDLQRKSATNLLSPRVLNQTVAKFLPKAPKKTLPLGKILEDEDYEVLLNIPEYGFTEDTLEEFKEEVIELAEDNPVTEDLFEPLEKRGFDTLLILSKTSRLVLESQKVMVEHQQVMVKHEKELEEKDKQINTLKGQLKDVNQQLNQHQQLLNQLTERLTLLEQQPSPAEAEVIA